MYRDCSNGCLGEKRPSFCGISESHLFFFFSLNDVNLISFLPITTSILGMASVPLLSPPFPWKSPWLGIPHCWQEVGHVLWVNAKLGRKWWNVPQNCTLVTVTQQEPEDGFSNCDLSSFSLEKEYRGIFENSWYHIGVYLFLEMHWWVLS